MPYDFNTAGPQREFGAVIPDGSFVWVIGTLRDGGVTPPWAGQRDARLFKGPRDPNSDVIMLDFEFTVQYGPYARQKFWQLFTIDGGSRDDHGNSKGGNISKNAIRAMLESAKGIRFDDASAAANQGRQIAAFRDLDGIPFGCRVEVEPGEVNPAGGFYPDKNRIAIVITADMPEYAPLRNGQDIAPQPKGRSARPAGATAGGAQPPAGWSETPPAPPPPPPQGNLWSGGQQPAAEVAPMAVAAPPAGAAPPPAQQWQQPAAPPPGQVAAPPAQQWQQPAAAVAAPGAAPAPAGEAGPGWLTGGG